jgi:hypothetical protein
MTFVRSTLFRAQATRFLALLPLQATSVGLQFRELYEQVLIHRALLVSYELL